MNEDEILDNPIVEDINIEFESEDIEQSDSEDISEELSLPDELDIEMPADEEAKTIDESFEDSIGDLEETLPENELDIDLPEVEKSEAIDEFLEENIEDDSVQENNSIDEEEVSTIEEDIEDLDLTNEEEPLSEDTDTIEVQEEELSEPAIETEDDIEEVQEESIVEEVDSSSEEESLQEEDPDSFELQEEEITEPTIEEEQIEVQDDIEEEPVEDISTDENLITNDLNNIKIEFGIEAKGFILSVNMMEAMIQKGYIFKDMLNDKVFDAVMIFNGNLENTVMTNDIKIKIENGKIQLIRGY